MTPAALRDIFLVCVQARRCSLCAWPLNGEAYWIDDAVRCADCGRMHGDPGARRCHAVYSRPSTPRAVA
jgi:hypothetical protein